MSDNDILLRRDVREAVKDVAIELGLGMSMSAYHLATLYMLKQAMFLDKGPVKDAYIRILTELEIEYATLAGKTLH
jgi:hypothetical protein